MENYRWCVKDSDIFRGKGFGAIYLDNKGTLFDVRHAGNNELMGQVQAAGIYVTQNETVGTVQQLNLVV